MVLMCLIAIGLLIGFIPLFWILFGIVTAGWLCGDNDPRPNCPDTKAPSTEWDEYDKNIDAWHSRYPNEERPVY